MGKSDVWQLSTASVRTIERWTIERIDRDSKWVRVESVPIKREKLNESLLKRLSKKGLEEGMDSFDMWDIGGKSTQGMATEKLDALLQVKDKEKEAVSENMVFWVVRPENENQDVKVFHASLAARKAASDIYKKVAFREGEKS